MYTLWLAWPIILLLVQAKARTTKKFHTVSQDSCLVWTCWTDDQRSTRKMKEALANSPRQGHINVVSLLLENKADVNHSFDEVRHRHTSKYSETRWVRWVRWVCWVCAPGLFDSVCTGLLHLCFGITKSVITSQSCLPQHSTIPDYVLSISGHWCCTRASIMHQKWMKKPVWVCFEHRPGFRGSLFIINSLRFAGGLSASKISTI